MKIALRSFFFLALLGAASVNAAQTSCNGPAPGPVPEPTIPNITTSI